MRDGAWPGVYALLLAAGGSGRFGGNKLTVSFRGEPLVRAAARIALASPAEHVLAIVGHEAAAVSEALSPLVGDRLSVVENPDWQAGLSSSLKAGLRALPPSAERVIIFLGDMPLVDVRLARELLALLENASAVLPTWCGKPAHPVVLRADAIPALMALDGDRGARETLARLPGTRLAEIGSEETTKDVDTADDLSRLAAIFER